MGTITAQSISDKFSILSNDATAVRWVENERLNWINEAQRAICALRPSAYVKGVPVPLVANVCEQSIPADGLQLIEITHNTNNLGTTEGRIIKLIPRKVLDDQRPTWRTEAAADEVTHYMFDPDAPKQFSVYRRPNGANYVHMRYGANPTDIAAIGNTITLDDIWEPAILDYLVYRAYSKSTNYAADGPRSAAAAAAFAALVTGKASAEMAFDPNRKSE